MGHVAPSANIVLRTPAGTFVIIRSVDQPPGPGRSPRSGQDVAGHPAAAARWRDALHGADAAAAIRRFYAEQHLTVAQRSDAQLLQDVREDIERHRLVVYFFADVHALPQILAAPAAPAAAPAGDVASWSMQDRLAEMFRRLPGHVPGALRGELTAFLSPENIRNMVAFFIGFALVQTIPGADAAADAVLTGLAWYFYGWGGAVAAYDLIHAVVLAATAKRQADLEQAAQAAATALVALGTVVLLKKLNDRVREETRQGGGSPKGDQEQPRGGGEGRGAGAEEKPPVPRIADPDKYVQTRVNQLNDQIPASSRGRITMAVAVVEDQSGAQSVLVGTSEPRGYLRPGVTLDPGETMVAGTGHAEADIVNYAAQNDLSVVSIGATRPVCAGCQSLIPDETSIATPLK